MSVSIFLSGGTFNFTCAGKPAPPRPTRPEARAASASCCFVLISGGGHTAGSCSINPSDVMMTASTACPPGIMTFLISFTVPETEEWIGTETYASLSATLVPTYTWSPFFTQGTHGAPMCCVMGSVISSGGGITRVSVCAVFLWCGTCAPPCVRNGRFGKDCSIFIPSFLSR